MGLRSEGNTPIGRSLTAPLKGSPLTRARSTASFLGGLTSSTERLNQRGSHASLLLHRGDEALQGNKSVSKETSRKSLAPGAREFLAPVETIGAQEFADALDAALGSIDSLRKNMVAFDPTKGERDQEAEGGGGGKGGGRRSSQAAGMSREDFDKRQERLEQFKMCRKIEPELPPLQRIKSERPKAAPQTDIMLRNASPDHLKKFSAEGKASHLGSLKVLNAQREKEVQALRQVMIEEKAELTQEKLEQKAQQGARASAMRRSIQPKASAEDTRDLRKDQMLERWMATCVMGAFVRQAHEEIKVRKMSDDERMAYISSTEDLQAMRRGNSSRFMRLAVKQAANIKEMSGNEQMLGKLGSLAVRMQFLLRRQKARSLAGVITGCLKAWKVSGRTFVHVKQFARRVVKMQRWWRRTRVQLREVRERVAKRWERLERQQLSLELNKAAPLPGLNAPRRSAAVDASRGRLEDRIKAALVPDEARLRFLEHELRVRRFNLLPEIACWEEDAAQWKKEWAEWTSERAAEAALGLNVGGGSPRPMPLMRWPPSRPSYLPKARGVEEEKGDEEILDMWRRCRASENFDGGWLKIQDYTDKASFKKAKRQGSKTAGGGGGGGAAEMSYGEEFVDEADLERWGVSAEHLPGATKQPPDRKLSKSRA